MNRVHFTGDPREDAISNLALELVAERDREYARLNNSNNLERADLSKLRIVLADLETLRHLKRRLATERLEPPHDPETR